MEKGTLAYDLGCLYNNKDHSDVIFDVDGEEIFAHKNILSARSEVFSAMFSHDMKENNTNRVAISDVDKDVFREFLKFLYTGQVPRIDQMAEELLKLAEEYNVPNLQRQCEEHFVRKLTVENCASFLILSEKFNTTWLKYKAYNFALSNFNSVQSTPEWAEWRNISFPNGGMTMKCVPPLDN